MSTWGEQLEEVIHWLRLGRKSSLQLNAMGKHLITMADNRLRSVAVDGIRGGRLFTRINQIYFYKFHLRVNFVYDFREWEECEGSQWLKD